MLLIASCNGNNKTVSKSSIKAVHQKQLSAKSTSEKPKIVESFSDSTTIGIKKDNKIELKEYAIADSNYVVIRFFSKRRNKWVIKNEYHFPKDGIAGCDPKISD